MARPKRMLSCGYCGKVFQVRSKRATYCSHACFGLSRVLPLEQLLWSRVTKGEDCWIISGSPTTDGYGRVVSQTQRRRKQWRAHVLAWTLASGAEPTDEQPVCHTCDNRQCVRNDDPGVYVVNGVSYPRFGHLFLGTVAANAKDSFIKGRNPNSFTFRQPHRYAFGENAGHAKLTEAQVREVRARKAAGDSYTVLERAYGLNRASLWDLVHRKTWAHVD